MLIYSWIEYDFFFHKMTSHVTKDKKLHIVDIGGNVGLFSLYCNHYFGVQEAIVVEPDPENFALMKHNLDANNVQWVFYDKALYAHKGEVLFDNTLSPSWRKISNQGKTVVETVSIADLINLDTTYDILKIDIEWWEWNILIKEHQQYYQRCSYIIIEYHITDKTEDPADIVNYFGGYNCEAVHINDRLWLLFFSR